MVHIYSNNLCFSDLVDKTEMKIPYKINETKLANLLDWWKRTDGCNYTNLVYIGNGFSDFKQKYFFEFKYDNLGLKIHFNQIV